MTKIALIAAMSNDRVIGINNQLPWHLPADLKHFKTITMGKPVIMGRKTYESIGKPLPNRHNIVITRNPSYKLAGCSVVHDLPAALKAAGDVDEIIIMGGAQLYAQALALANYMYLTLVDITCKGDAHFPEWPTKQWQKVASETHCADDVNRYAYTFLELAKNN